MTQTWHDLLFAHWSFPAEVVRTVVPRELPLWEGRAWVAVTPFRVSCVRPRGIPALPGLSAFPELNVRTYVTLGGKGGVLFLQPGLCEYPRRMGRAYVLTGRYLP